MNKDVKDELGNWFYLFGIGVLILAIIIFILCYGRDDLDFKIERALRKEYDLFIDGKEVFHNSNPMYYNSNGYKVIIDNDKKVVNFESIQ